MADETPKESSSKESPSQFESLKHKVKGLRTNPNVGKMKRFFSQHSREVISGGLVVFGIIADFVSWVGGVFVACGVVLGFYPEIHAILKNLQSYYAKNGTAKNAVFCGLLLFFLLNMFAFTLSFLVLCVILVLLVDSKGKGDSSQQP
ncbi:hypothetical protein [Chlamydia gallinacea]|uniref:Uncharacterized protein n=2 Tax=Chlamydia gallinacea TaxID=1457153 RepID=A0A173DYK1_9CHLA|nr:hypothetical protein [Chlamydia gallinacea]EYE60686.1 hypothetical protein M127_5526 [Bacteroides fragilis str. S6L5]ANG66005.1 hypothetical protein M787_001545 [Chlamydia gallinacea 08-1274/3]AQT77767.1 hypothetical protein B1F83_04080 [Chlamydia gallinacea]MBX6680084.1 hypothetical protein [Chlamydia gallinacea]MBX6687316.1 hypothetical protein [Chlamydia gallinacea]